MSDNVTVLRGFHYRPFGLLRFTLAMLVMIQHFCSDIAPDWVKQIVTPFAPGNVAVLGFFIMSGFIICEAYYHNYQARPVAYIKNRFMRIYPGYAAALVLSLSAHLYFVYANGQALSLDRHTIGASYFDAGNLARNIFSLIPPIQVNMTDTTYPFIPYAWALQTETMFYLTVFFVGLFAPFLLRTTKLPQNFWFAVAGYIGILAAAFTQFSWLPKQLAYGSYFAFGGALFFYLHGHRKALWILLPAFAQMLWHFAGCDAEDFTVIAANRFGQFVILALILVALVKLAVTKIKDKRIDKMFGELSYPLYLNHYVIGILIANSFDNFSIATLVGGIAASLALSAAMYTGIDKPLARIRSAIRRKS